MHPLFPFIYFSQCLSFCALTAGQWPFWKLYGLYATDLCCCFLINIGNAAERLQGFFFFCFCFLLCFCFKPGGFWGKGCYHVGQSQTTASVWFGRQFFFFLPSLIRFSFFSCVSSLWFPRPSWPWPLPLTLYSRLCKSAPSPSMTCPTWCQRRTTTTTTSRAACWARTAGGSKCYHQGLLWVCLATLPCVTLHCTPLGPAPRSPSLPVSRCCVACWCVYTPTAPSVVFLRCGVV